MGIEYFGGPRTLNGLAVETQTFAVASSGTDFGIASVGSAHTFSIPDASASARGLVTTGAQTIAGNKTFSGDIFGAVATFTGQNFLANNTATGTYNFTRTGDSSPLLTLNQYSSSTAARRVEVRGAGIFGLTEAGAEKVALGQYGIRMTSGLELSWSDSTTSTVTTRDLFLVRDAAGTLAQRDSTNAQNFRLYNTYTSATSFETLQIKANAGAAYQIGSAIGSAGGINRAVELGHYDSAGTFTSALSIGTSYTVIVNSASNAGRLELRNGSSGNLVILGNSSTGHCTINNLNSVGGDLIFHTRSAERMRFTGVGGITISDVIVSNSTLTFTPSAAVTLATNGQFSIEMTSNTAGNLVYRGSDGTTRRMGMGFGSTAVSYLPLTGGTLNGIIGCGTEIVNTPAGTTQTINLNSANHQTLSLVSATGTVTVTLTVPTVGSSSGTIIVEQHASAVKDITWAVSSGSIKWLGTEPDWSTDAATKERVVAWRFNGTNMYLSATDST